MRRVRHILFLLMLIGTLGMIGLIMSITWEQFQDTKEWQTTTLGGDLKDAPPFLARNYVKAEDKDAVAVWGDVNKTLTEINESGGIPDGKRNLYEEVLAAARKKQERYQLTSGDIVEANDRLQLYLDTEKALASAYESPDTDGLKAISDRLYGAHIKKAVPVDDVYLGRLQEVASDYKALSVFLSESLPKLGLIENKTLTVKINVGPKVTEAVKTALEEGNLRKFPFLEDLYQMMNGSVWTNILRRNEISRAYQKWKDAESSLKSVTKSQYYAASTILTYQQALDAGLYVRVREQDGYIIDPLSHVRSITYNGEAITENQYIRYGTSVVVTIEENYIELPPEEPEIPELPDEAEEPNEPEEPLPDESEADDGWRDEW